MIDLRSDTITRPTPKMLVAMTSADVGDDVFGEDATANIFQQKVANMFGKEAGLFVPSGTMCNQLGVKVLTNPGDELLIDKTGHIFNYESGAGAFLSGVQMQTLEGERGKLSVDILKNRKRGTYDWEPSTKLICLENTTNKGGGACYSREELTEIKAFADEQGLLVHLDGARIWNAMAATGIEPEFFGNIAETISVCFSKGLGAPVGSMLLGDTDTIKRAKRFRKMWGGGMRQIGILAAAANYAVDHNQALLAEDHRRAKEFARFIQDRCSQLYVQPDNVESNIVIFDVKQGDAASALAQLESARVRMVQFGPQTIRATFHFQVTDDDTRRVHQIFAELFG